MDLDALLRRAKRSRSPKRKPALDLDRLLAAAQTPEVALVVPPAPTARQQAQEARAQAARAQAAVAAVQGAVSTRPLIEFPGLVLVSPQAPGAHGRIWSTDDPAMAAAAAVRLPGDRGFRGEIILLRGRFAIVADILGTGLIVADTQWPLERAQPVQPIGVGRPRHNYAYLVLSRLRDSSITEVRRQMELRIFLEKTLNEGKLPPIAYREATPWR
jgi:hypothetical protein